MAHLEAIWKAWLANTQVEIASNFGIQATSSIGQPFVVTETSLREHHHSAQTIQYSSCNKLRAHCWALRRVQEIKSLCSREHKAWRSFKEPRHLCSKLRQYAKAGHLDIGHSLATDIETVQEQHNNNNEQLWDSLNANNKQSMASWIGYLKSVIGTYRRTRVKPTGTALARKYRNPLTRALR